MQVTDLATPCLILDDDRLQANVERVLDRANALGLDLRPHFKTPKSLPILQRMAGGAGRCSATVSTLREAETLAAAGWRDILLTTPIAPQRLPQVRRLQDLGARTTVTIDSVASARALADAALEHGVEVDAVLEIDVDGFRGGVALESADLDEAIEVLARASVRRHLRVAGVLVYPGASGRLPDVAERAALGERHRRAAVQAQARLKAADFSASIVSFGSTSVLMALSSAEGLTEHRGGIYAFQDLHQAGLGWCGRDDIALRVLATVVSHRPAQNRIVIDAGALALSKDRSTAPFDFDAQYGWLVDPVSYTPIEDLWVETVYQEHGFVTSASGRPAPFERLPVGARVSVEVNHADITAAAYERYNVVKSGRLVDVYDRVNGW